MPTSKTKKKWVLLPNPDCEFGYTQDQLREILGDDDYDAFLTWHRGRRFVDCDGTRLYRDFGASVSFVGECCEGKAHGWVYYYSDIREFIQKSA